MSCALDARIVPYAQQLLLLYPPAILTSCYRSYTDQFNLYLNRANNPYPVAPPGYSYHQYYRAFDVSAPRSVLEQLGAVWRSWGGTWDESDVIHFEA